MSEDTENTPFDPARNPADPPPEGPPQPCNEAVPKEKGGETDEE